MAPGLQLYYTDGQGTCAKQSRKHLALATKGGMKCLAFSGSPVDKLLPQAAQFLKRNHRSADDEMHGPHACCILLHL